MKNKIKLQKKVSEIITQFNELGDELVQADFKTFEINLNSGGKLVWVRKGELNISSMEMEILQDIRQLKHGRVVIYVQDSIVINKEVTKATKMPKKT